MMSRQTARRPGRLDGKTAAVASPFRRCSTPSFYHDGVGGGGC